VPEAGAPVAARLSVAVDDPALCPRFVGRWVSGVTIGPSPDMVQMRLLAAGMRPISNVVDASNYVMLELGKPIHTFDARSVDGGRLRVRLARAGERLQTLDHVDRDLDAETLLIADDRGPLAIAGVMGGADSEVSDTTTEVIVESAIFDPVSIRRTAFRYALRSEASLRFEKGQETRLARLGADRAAQLLARWAGGVAAPGRVDTAPLEPDRERVAFRPARTTRLLGLGLGVDEQAALLGRVGIEVEVPPADAPTVAIPVARGTRPLTVESPAFEALVALVPTWRRDILVEADVIEELARVNGYDAIPTTLPATPMPVYRPTPLAFRDGLRTALAGLGLREVVNHALVSPRHVETWAWSSPPPAAAGETEAAGTPITVTNPLSSDHAVMRQGLVGSLVETVAANRRRGRDDVAIFEVGKGYGRVGDEPHEWWRLGIGLAGAFDVPAWNRERRVADLDDLKGIVEALAAMFGLGRPIYGIVADEPTLHPGRAATVTCRRAGGELAIAGVIGEVHPAVAAAWDERTVGSIVAELSIAGLSGGALPVPRGVAPSRHQDVERDIAVVVPMERPAAEIEDVIREHAGALLKGLRLFDVYRGLPLGETERSLAFRLTFGDPERTLTEPEIEAAMGAVVSALVAAGGHIRS
jgi:phenylalanyl-tRNA synthetase beta chain